MCRRWPSTCPAPFEGVTLSITRSLHTAVTASVVAVSVALAVVVVPAPAAGAATTVKIGAWAPNSPYGGSGALDALEADIGRDLDFAHYYQSWAVDNAFNTTWADAAASGGRTPMITWEPWDYRTGGSSQPTYRLATIADGTHDSYIRRWARDAAGWGKPLLVRFAHEMNTTSYPWSELTNGNQPGDYVRAWRHVHDLLDAEGATNVQLVWSPNVSYDGTQPLAQIYPGDAYVDWVGVDGYNGGTALPWGGWLTFGQIFGPTLHEIRAITTTKPVMLAEVASVEQGGSKADWIRDLFAQLPTYPEIDAIVWFNENKEADWRIQSSSSSLEAFREAVAPTTTEEPATEEPVDDTPVMEPEPEPTTDDGTTKPGKGNGRLKKFAAAYSAAIAPQRICGSTSSCSSLFTHSFTSRWG